jgi:hypothetical protein
MNTTFRPLGDITEFVVMKTAFLMALDEWTGRSEDDFPRNAPPVPAVKDDTSDESAELAAVFIRLCRLRRTSDRLALLGAEIIVHERRLAMALDLAKGEPEEGLTALQPYSEMIDVLKDWLEAVHDRACEP